MEWKANARKFPKCSIKKSMEGNTQELAPEPIRMHNGKPKVMRTHARDIVEEMEDGTKQVFATVTLKEGEYAFPKAYFHKRLRFVGFTTDARYTDRGWAVYLKGELRDKSGSLVKFEGSKVDMSGWYLESALKDAGLGPVALKLGKMSMTITQLEKAREERIARASARRKA